MIAQRLALSVSSQTSRVSAKSERGDLPHRESWGCVLVGTAVLLVMGAVAAADGLVHSPRSRGSLHNSIRSFIHAILHAQPAWQTIPSNLK